MHGFDMITRKNETKIFKYRFDEKRCNSDQWWNNDKCLCECKLYVCQKDYTWNPATCSCENAKYLASIMDNSAITCDEIMESYNQEASFN